MTCLKKGAFRTSAVRFIPCYAAELLRRCSNPCRHASAAVSKKETFMLYIFDMGGVVTSDANAPVKVASALGLTLEQFMQICKAEDKDLLELCSNGVIGAKEFWSLFEQRSKIHAKTDWWHALFHPILNEGTVSIIKKLKEQGHRVICGTNTMQSHYLNHLERGDYSFFDQTYASCLMGISKPDPLFWQIILQAEETLAKDAVFIDDRIENVEGAATLGIRAIRFTTAQNLKEELHLE